jgi:hypothetical protein
MNRDAVIAAVPCCVCGAEVNEPCRGQGPLHAKRVGRAEMLHGWRDRAPDAVLARLKQQWRGLAPARRRRARGRG